jgi:hypothetical protein
LPSLEYDLRYLRAGLEELSDYLLSDDLFWPINTSPPSGESPYPRLTLGNLMLSKKRLQARSLLPDQQIQFTKFTNQIEIVSTKWRVAWEKKASHGFRSRLSMWKNFLDEYYKHPPSNADRYTYEVRLRVILHLLDSEISDKEESEIKLLSSLDTLLRAVLVKNKFIWDSVYEGGFESEDFWYLFGKLPETLP